MKLFRFIFIILLIILNIYTFSHTRYENLSEGGSPNLFQLIKWKITREKPEWPDLNNRRAIERLDKITDINNEGELRITYVNHSTFLIQMSGVNILTDPIWSEYAGPYGKFGIKRSIEPGLTLEQLPKIDFILISHSHYDHLDMPTIDFLTEVHKPIILTGLGVSELINYCKQNSSQCHELNWWDNLKIENVDLDIHFVPAHHWSGRFLFDKNNTLWGGFVINNKKDNIYFAGDTGFGDGRIFKELKNHFRDFTVSLLPIGSYKPRWFFEQMHISPEETVKIFEILGAQHMIPMHYDTFQLSDEKYSDPLQDLNIAMTKSFINQSRVKVLEPGQSLLFSKN